MVLTSNLQNRKMDQRTGTKRERERVDIIQSQNDESPGKRSRISNENYPTIQLAGPLRYQDQQVRFSFLKKCVCVKGVAICAR